MNDGRNNPFVRFVRQRVYFLVLGLLIGAISWIVFTSQDTLFRKNLSPRVAFVLDDWGYNLKAVSLLREIDRPLTIAVLPHLHYSEKIAIEAHAQGHEIILHIPMEPKGNHLLEKMTIRTVMSKEDVRRILLSSLSSIPHVIGVSNHQGSKASEDRRTMTALFKTLRDEGYFYLDSLTTDASKASEIAKEMSLPFLKRDIFLDNQKTKSAIQSRLDELKHLALQKGTAIGIGHNEFLTLDLLE